MDLFNQPEELDWPSRDFAFPVEMMNIKGVLKEYRDPDIYKKAVKGILPFQRTTKGIV